MADSSRLDDLRRRVEKDPASIAFAQLAEEYRRAGQFQQAVEVCHAGLKVHPGYLSAHVTLGRALVELNQLDEAQAQLELVLHNAPENLAAIRGLAEIYHRRGDLADALAQYRAALALARNDPDLERTVEELARQVAPQPRAEPANGLSFDQMAAHLAAHAPAFAVPAIEAASARQAPARVAPAAVPAIEAASVRQALAPVAPAAPVAPVAAPVASAVPASRYNAPPDAKDDRGQRTIAALTKWLDALNVPRPDIRP